MTALLGPTVVGVSGGQNNPVWSLPSVGVGSPFPSSPRRRAPSAFGGTVKMINQPNQR